MAHSPLRKACLLGLGVLASGCSGKAKFAVSTTLSRVDVRPSGVRRGFATELTIRRPAVGANPRLIAPFRFAAEPLPPGEGADATTFRLKITADPSTPLGIYPARVLTDEILSNPFPLAVGQLPRIEEKEDNNNIDWKLDENSWTAQKVTTPTVIEGELPIVGGDKDYDYFRFKGRKGQWILADIQCARLGSGTDIHLWIGSLDRGYRAGTHLIFEGPADTPLVTKLPEDADYLFGVSRAYYRPIKGGGDRYRLTLGALPAAAEVYPLGGRRGETVRVELRGGTLDEMMVVPVTLTPEPGESVVRLRVPTTFKGPDGLPLDVEALPPLLVGDLPECLEPTDPRAPTPRATPPVVFNGRIDAAEERDAFKVAVTPGQRLRVEVASRSLGSALLPKLKVLDAANKDLAEKKAGSRWDYTIPARDGVPEHARADPWVELVVPDGQTELTILMSGDWRDDPLSETTRSAVGGGSGHAYRVTVVPVTPDFSVTLDEAQVSVPQGGSVKVGLKVNRDGFDGPITIRVAALPAGLGFRPGVIPAGRTTGSFTLTADPDASVVPFVLEVFGEGAGPKGPIIVRATKVVAFGALTTEPFRSVIDRIEGKPVYSDTPAYQRIRVPTQTGLFVTTVKAASRPSGRPK